MYADLGFSAKVGGKSAKVLGVSLAFSAGLTSEQVRILGRWASAETARHYYNVSDKTILNISSTLTLATMHLDVSKQVLRQKGSLQNSMIQHGPLAYIQHKEVQDQSAQLSDRLIKEVTGQPTVVDRMDMDSQSVPVSAVRVSTILQSELSKTTVREEVASGTGESVPLKACKGRTEVRELVNKEQAITVRHKSCHKVWICSLKTGYWKDVVSLDNEGFPIVNKVPYVKISGEEDLIIESVNRFTVKIDG